MRSANPYVSIDIETTGLDDEYCQVLEFGAVIDDWKTPVETLPSFHCYVVHERIRGEAYALALNAAILRRIAERSKPENAGYNFYKPQEVGFRFSHWLQSHERSYKIDRSAVVAAGKNFGSFDRSFLRRLDTFSDQVKFHHRCVDPGMLFWNPETDAEPPGTKTCMERAGIAGEVAHTAVADAITVIKLVRFANEARKLRDSDPGYPTSCLNIDP